MPLDIGLFPLFFLEREHSLNVTTTIFIVSQINHTVPCSAGETNGSVETCCKQRHACNASVDALPVLVKILKNVNLK